VRALIGLLVLVRFALPLLTLHAAWEIHRDEFLYFAMGDHLDVFRMQFPPLIAVVARMGRMAFGDAVWAARVPAAAAGALLTAVVLLLVRRLGGGRLAMLLAWTAMLAAPLIVRASVLMQPVIFDLLWAALATTGLTLAAHERNPRWWLLVGAALGLGALTKFSVAFVGASIGVASLLVPDVRRQLATRWPWVALVIAAMLAVPSVTGQILHDWPFLQQMDALRRAQLDRVDAVEFLSGQLLMLASALVCVVAGVGASVRAERSLRAPVLVGASIVLLMLLLHGKAYYAGPAYPVLIAVGALAIERSATRRPWLGRAAMGTMVIGAVVLWPLGVPSLSPAASIRYAAALGAAEAVETNQGVTLQLPQDFADMLGWRALTDSVGAVVQRLPADQRADLTVAGNNYGQAGALAFYRRRVGIPYPISTAGDFFAWGPGPASGNTVIVVGAMDDRGDLSTLFTSVEIVQTIQNPLGVPEEQQVAIFRARHAPVPLRERWSALGPNW
jgi:4-amino-4-deoxy-L-arabinose transferase-like glycosyltransferase